MFLKILFLESVERGHFLKKYPPCKIYIFSKRVVCAKNGEFGKYRGNFLSYAWFVWTKEPTELTRIDFIF